MASKKIISEWVRLADEDLKLAEHLIGEDWFYRAALAHLQQAVEKYTKAFLISKNWELRKIHDLETLFAEASKHQPFFKNYLDFGRGLTAYYTESRYPPLFENEPSRAEAVALLKISRELIEKIKMLLKE
jgi:HEPN domain-containing protein